MYISDEDGETMAVFKINIKRLLKDKLNLFFMIILPAIAISFSTFFSTSVEAPYTIGIITDTEKSPEVKLIEKELKKCFNIKPFDRSKSIVNQMVQSGIDCVIDLTNKNVEDILNQKRKSIKMYTFGKSETHMIVKEYLNSTIRIIISQKRLVHDYLKVSENILSYAPAVKTNIIHQNSKQLPITFASGFFVMSLFWLALNASNIILKDYHERVILRILCAPISKQSYILQSILSIFSVTLIQIIFFVVMCTFGLKLSFGQNIAAVILVLSACSFMFVAFGVMLISIVNDMRKLSTINSMVVTIMCMLGGCYWPLNIMPNFLQKIALIFPTTYAAVLTKNVLLSKPLGSMFLDIIIVISFCILFILVGIKQLSKNLIAKV